MTTTGWARIGLAGPGAILVTLAVTGGMTRWLPAGAAGIDNLVLPIVLLPLIWSALFFYACLDRRVSRVALVFAGLAAAHVALVAYGRAGPARSIEEPAR